MKGAIENVIGGVFTIALVLAIPIFGWMILFSKAVLISEKALPESERVLPFWAGMDTPTGALKKDDYEIQKFLCKYFTGTRTVTIKSSSDLGCQRIVSITPEK